MDQTTEPTLEERIAALELAVITIGRVDLGDSEGHPFRGNQWKNDGSGSEKPTEAQIRASQPKDSKAIGDVPHLKALHDEHKNADVEKVVAKDPILSKLIDSPPAGFGPHPRGGSAVRIYDGPKNGATGEIMKNPNPDRPYAAFLTVKGRDVTPDEFLDGFKTADEAAAALNQIASKKTGKDQS